MLLLINQLQKCPAYKKQLFSLRPDAFLKKQDELTNKGTVPSYKNRVLSINYTNKSSMIVIQNTNILNYTCKFSPPWDAKIISGRCFLLRLHKNFFCIQFNLAEKPKNSKALMRVSFWQSRTMLCKFALLFHLRCTTVPGESKKARRLQGYCSLNIYAMMFCMF